MRKLILVMSVVLNACAPTMTVIKEPVEVLVPVRVPCEVKPVPKPKFAMDKPGLAGEGVFQKGLAAISELEQRKDYEASLEAVIAECTKPTKH